MPGPTFSGRAVLIDLAILFGLGLLLLILSHARVSVEPMPTAPVPTLAIIPDLTLPTLSLPSFSASTGVASSTEPEPEGNVPFKALTVPPQRAPSPGISASSTPSVPVALESAPGTPIEQAAVALRKALVNIVCIAPPGSGIRSISASGVIIDPKGIILTNAHVAQYTLLASRKISCSIRMGSPASGAYTAALLYLPSSWMAANAGVLMEASPVGTGEHDYALLAITGDMSGASLPSSFSSIPLAEAAPSLGLPVAVASYGAQSLGYSQIQTALYPTVVYSSVKDVFTFDTDTVDVIALGGSSAAQEGSSGGGVVRADGKLVGTITTSTVEGDITSRSLDAITASYIRSDFLATTDSSLEAVLSQGLTTSLAKFNKQTATLQTLLFAHLP